VSSQAATARLTQRAGDLDVAFGAEVAAAPIAAFREWEHATGERFAELKRIQQPTLVVNGTHDEMIPVRNSYWLSENLRDAVLLTYPDSGHGALFQFHQSFSRGSHPRAFHDLSDRLADQVHHRAQLPAMAFSGFDRQLRTTGALEKVS
jgi:pimeloyl-ACP methyl ester carboxylesterase